MTPADRQIALSLLKRRQQAAGIEKMHLTGALQKILLDNAEFLLKERTYDTVQDGHSHSPYRRVREEAEDDGRNKHSAGESVMPYPDDYVARGAPDSEPPLHDDAPEPISAAEAARFEAEARPYRAILAALRQVADAARMIGTAEMMSLSDWTQDAINDCTPLAAILSWDSEDDPFFVRQAFDHMMDETKTAKVIR